MVEQIKCKFIARATRMGLAIATTVGMFSALTVDAAEVTLTGIPKGSDLYQTVSGGSLLIEQAGAENTASSQEIVAAAQADYGRLLAVLYDNGYFGPVIQITLDGTDAAAVPPVQAPRSINRAMIKIDTGPQFRFGTAKIAPMAAGTELPDGFASGPRQGERLAAQELTARHTDRTVNATLRLAPGPVLRFGGLAVKGNKAVRTARIIDIAGLPQGEVYAPDELRRAARRLRRTGAFSAVALLEAERIGPNDTLPITAQVTESLPRRFGYGAELGSLEGLTLSAFWLHRNLLGGAERLRIEGEISGIGGNSGGEDYTLSARFERPATFNEDTNFYALAKIEQLDEVNYFSRQLDLEAGIERIASEERTYTLGLGLRRAQTRDAFGENEYTLLTLPLGAEFDYRDDRLNAKNGYYINASVTPFLAISGSDNGLRTTLDARAYRTFGTTRPVTFALRGQLGSVYGPELGQAPADYLFYSGGGGTVRGQSYQALGVDLGGGNVTGGRSFLAISAEARVSVTDKIGIVGFVDGGYIGAEEFYDGSGVWHSGAGLGLRYNTGIGPIRVDVAVPTSGPQSDEKFQIYIGIGQSF
ncbi:Translocation and assembly module subunit TamA [Nymphon striatum]|nr:Translocation and assembly module subunit TamA [Nymphon striatum]